jgi:enoyl-CoA hydratase/carnithine racemase
VSTWYTNGHALEGAIAVSWTNLEIERRGPILRVWLNRPEKLNALDTASLEEIEALFRETQSDFDTKVVVLAGRGPSFCAGADRGNPPGGAQIVESSDASDRERRYAAQLGRRACCAIQDTEAVTIARVHGHAVGGGLALALACDLRIAAENASFHVPEVDLGVPLSWGAAPRLISEVGVARAREILLLCDRFDAPCAERWGVVQRCVPEAELDAAVDVWAERIAAKPEVAVHMTKTQLRAYGRQASLGDVSEADGDLLLGAFRAGAARDSFRRK